MSDKFILSVEDARCACQDDLPALVQTGLELFNAGEYFNAHEVLEEAWREEAGPVREMYRGILQVAVAYYHIQRGNYIGAMKMFSRARKWLDPFPDRCRGIDLAHFKVDYRHVEEAVRAAGPERIEWFDRRLFRAIRFS